MIDPLISRFAERLTNTYTENSDHALQVALWLCQKASGFSSSSLIINASRSLDTQMRNQVAQWIDQLVVEHKPLQYILGDVPFCGLTISVVPPLLIPRPETEEWVIRLIDDLHHYRSTPLQILDLCTGTGCIALALAKSFPQSSITAVDINEHAVTLAQKNSSNNGIDTIQFLHSDLYSAVINREFDLIVANPPYISESEWQNLDLRVRNFEDRRALIASDDGYELIEKIIDNAPQFLKKDSPIRQLVVEIGSRQAERALKYGTDRGTYAILGYDTQNLPRTITYRWL